ncbi:MAG: alpha/beta fold hydrolase [Solirubrobacterales bacterium]|nr:alpha/beta hydrolase [Solirubrobacterales bacterium]
MSLSAIDVGDGPTAVLLHGQPGNAGDWWPVTSHLLDRMRVIAPDRPGYGRTGGPPVGFRGNAEAVSALLDDLELESAVVAGHSWGTGVALDLARRFPERVRALVLASPVAPGASPGVVDRVLGHPLVGAPVTRIGFRLAGLGLALGPARSLARKFVRGLPAAQVAATAAEWRGDAVWRSFYAEQRALITELPSLQPELRSIEQETTLLRGTRDWISPPAHAALLASAMPRTELVAVEGVGHMLPQQRPELIAEAIVHAGR